jgi:hypothetical protein
MLYKIRKFCEFSASILIEIEGYHSLIAIDLPLDENNNVPVGEELNKYINGFIPYFYIERAKKLKNKPVKNADIIKKMIEPL